MNDIIEQILFLRNLLNLGNDERVEQFLITKSSPRYNNYLIKFYKHYCKKQGVSLKAYEVLYE